MCGPLWMEGAGSQRGRRSRVGGEPGDAKPAVLIRAERRAGVERSERWRVIQPHYGLLEALSGSGSLQAGRIGKAAKPDALLSQQDQAGAEA